MREASEILVAYRRLERSFPIVDRSNGVTYDSPVNFNESMRTPRHRWFPYKEGFSPSFVRSFLEEFGQPSSRVLDPFAGVGTTIIQGSMQGHFGVGFDVNPLANFVSETKSVNLSDPEVKTFRNSISDFQRADLTDTAVVPPNATVLSYFSSDVLEALLRIKSYYLNVLQGKTQALFKLAFLGLLERYSTHRKAGNGLKRKTGQQPSLFGDVLTSLKSDLVATLTMMAEDLGSTSISKAHFIYGSSLSDDLYPAQPFDCVLTSPPYANCFDYSKIYICELWLGDFFKAGSDQSDFRQNSVRSHVHATWPERHQDLGSQIVSDVISPYLESIPLWSKRIPDMLQGYFSDIGRLFQVLRAKTTRGCRVGLVVSNSAYGGIPVATDLLVGEVASAHGFTPERVEIYRRTIPSSQQYVQPGTKEYYRESLVVVRKS